jgi:hypothetical protein
MENNGLILLANIATQILQHRTQQQVHKIFNCDLCYADYGTLRGIREHLQKKHGIWGGKATVPQNNDCPFCKIPHQNAHAMIRHIFNVHRELASEWYSQHKKIEKCKFCSNSRCCCSDTPSESAELGFTVYTVP